MKKIVTMIPTTLVTNLILFLNSKTKVKFLTMGTKNISVFCLWRVSLYFKGMLKSTELYKGIVLHINPVQSTVPL